MSLSPRRVPTLIPLVVGAVVPVTSVSVRLSARAGVSSALNAPVVGMAATPTGGGYFEVASDEGIFTFGTAQFFGTIPVTSPRIVLYGDSLGMESAQDFSFFAAQSAAPVLVRTYGETAVCDFLQTTATDASDWRPSVAVLEFSGNNLTPCMAGDAIGTASCYEKYRSDTRPRSTTSGRTGSGSY